MQAGVFCRRKIALFTNARRRMGIQGGHAAPYRYRLWAGGLCSHTAICRGDFDRTLRFRRYILTRLR
jgi:hypothetical protein